MGNQKNQVPTENRRDQNSAGENETTNKTRTPDKSEGLYPKQAPAKGADSEDAYEEMQDEITTDDKTNPSPNDPSRVDRTGTPEKENDPTRIRREANDPAKVDPTRIANTSE